MSNAARRENPGAIPALSDELAIEAAEAYKEAGGNKAEAARRLNLKESTFKGRLKVARSRGFLAPRLEIRKQSILYDQDGMERGRWDKLGLPGMDPEDRVHLPDPKTITKVSTLYDQEGRVTQQWVAERPQELAKEAAWRALAEELASSLPRAKPVSAPRRTTEDLMACYPVGDHHLGMLAWKDETGASWDLDIGEQMLCRAADFL